MNLLTFTSFFSSPPPLNAWIILVIILGLIIGSFLNVVIYRGSAKYNGGNYKGKLTISEPKTSFCPTCLAPLHWYENIPIISWIIQRGRCNHCKSPISAQYPAIEGINTILWVGFYTHCPTIGDFLINSITASILLAAATIDIKTSMIPNKLTIGSTVGILVLGSLIVANSLHDRLFGILAGFGIMLVMIQLGKVLFGKKTTTMKKPVPFIWDWQGGKLTIQDEGKSLEESDPIEASELFSRKSDTIEIVADIKTNKGKFSREKVRIKHNATYLVNNGDTSEITDPQPIEGKIKTITFPREAMGMGDAKLMAFIGASMGPIPMLYTLVSAACAGAIVGILIRLYKAIKKENPPNTMVFGPWLAAAAIAIMFYNL
jgi:leader peptidase (prepilin peptidase)/N-methyltransferase